MNLYRRLRRVFAAAPRTLHSTDAYALWARAYPPHAHNQLMHSEEQAVLSLLPVLDGVTVLDLACGSGRYARIARERGAQRVFGVDNSPEMLAVARQSISDVIFACAEMNAIPLPDACVDVMVCGLAIGHAAEISVILREVARVLTPEGCAILSDFHPHLFLTGKRRTFTAPDGSVYAVEHYVHLVSHLMKAAVQAGMRLDVLDEPSLMIDGKSQPAVVVYGLSKG